MRFFKLDGQYAGDHPIYESRKEFREKFPNESVFVWSREFNKDIIDSLEAGDWIEATDGYIVLCLNVRVWKQKTGRNKYIVRVPMGTFYISERVDGSFFYQRLFAQFAQHDMYSLSGKKKVYRDTTINKQLVLFAQYLNANLSPYEAFKKAGGITNQSYASIQMKLINWLTREEVMEMTKDHKNDFLEKIKEDEAFSDEAMIQYLKDFILRVRKGSQTHLNSMNLLLTLTGKLDEPVGTKTKDNKLKAQEVAYEDVPPPELEQ